ncbi:MAG: sulfite exporter TauE/SafE family protein, partial [Sphingomonas sp.]|uniref:sulfite exporter TauE/SafE family protein n=1 Tax=Sphingomonas sp. TaxID=28214 RepID=UPI0025846D29
MIVEATPLAGLVLGFAGSAHCVGMCGGVASALDRVATGSGWRRLASHGLYAVGRVGSYAVLGSAVGGLGQAFADQLPSGFQTIVRWAVGALLIALGISLMRLRALRGLERMGASVWRRLQPLAGRIVRFPAPLRSLALGALWGWLPCGLVYSAAGVAAVTGSAASGAMFMIAFGVGTLPAVLSLGTAASGLWSKFGQRRMQGVSGAIVV